MRSHHRSQQLFLLKRRGKSSSLSVEEELRKHVGGSIVLNMIPEFEVVDFNENSPSHDEQTVMVEAKRCSKSRLNKRACISKTNKG